MSHISNTKYSPRLLELENTLSTREASLHFRGDVLITLVFVTLKSNYQGLELQGNARTISVHMHTGYSWGRLFQRQFSTQQYERLSLFFSVPRAVTKDAGIDRLPGYELI